MTNLKSSTQNVKVEKARGMGYFLTLGEEGLEQTWAVTALELLILLKMLRDMEEELQIEDAKIANEQN